ncbi:hypothetical protein QR680_015050 [Steinernema hermaphroditum]|uniref:MD-2-related lipid-recognition domain-containing protein n=1 Tax=Steinernema hermaphroditum TaxID=289476 RepID=A0AA39ICE7_9BILA|nr:hypothetical protein QR680_015050 [Steinernema hermaphroditum]
MKLFVLFFLVSVVAAMPARIAMRPIWVYGPCTKEVGCPYATDFPEEDTTVTMITIQVDKKEPNSEEIFLFPSPAFGK